MSQFENETAATLNASGEWLVHLDEHWCIAGVPNGGYLLAIAGRVLSQALPHPDPLSVTALYVAPTTPGPALCSVEILRSGKQTTQAQLRMFQQGDLKVQVNAAFTNLDGLNGESWMQQGVPDFPPRDRCVLHANKQFKLHQRIALRIAEGTEVFRRGTPPCTGAWDVYLEFADGAAPDPLALLMFADACPPPVFTVVGPVGWVPTVDLNVQVRARPAPGPIRAQMRSRYLTRGVVEEDGTYWDSEDQLVAISRQTAKVRVPEGNLRAVTK